MSKSMEVSKSVQQVCRKATYPAWLGFKGLLRRGDETENT